MMHHDLPDTEKGPIRQTGGPSPLSTSPYHAVSGAGRQHAERRNRDSIVLR